MTLRTVVLHASAALLVFALAAGAPAQQQPPPGQKRDLKVERLNTEPATTAQAPKTPPRSYAVVIGISRYPKLAEKFQLRFPERDAQSMNTILISPEGGSFKAENVKVLTGPQATLAAMRREIDEWLPSVAKEGDRITVACTDGGDIAQSCWHSPGISPGSHRAVISECE